MMWQLIRLFVYVELPLGCLIGWTLLYSGVVSLGYAKYQNTKTDTAKLRERSTTRSENWCETKPEKQYHLSHYRNGSGSQERYVAKK